MRRKEADSASRQEALSGVPVSEPERVPAAPGQSKSNEISPHDVNDRNQLNDYLSQSLVGQYRERSASGNVMQVATYVKSYLVEGHIDPDRPTGEHWSHAFRRVLPRRDKKLLLLFDRDDVPYFADITDSRFILLHTIGKTQGTDDTVERLTSESADGFDRAWLPTDFLYGTRRGPLRGFKFGHLTAVKGIGTDAEEDFDGEVSAYPEESEDTRLETARLAVLSDSVDNDLYPTLPAPLLGRTRIETSTSKLTLTNTLTADRDFQVIRDLDVFAGRQALDSIQFLARDATDRVRSTVYSSGKVVASGNSIGLHLVCVDSLRNKYGRVIRRIEDDFALGWLDSDAGYVHNGEPLIFRFPEGLVTNLPEFVGSIFRATHPFRLFGIPHSVDEDRIDVEAIDLHNHDPLSFEITHSWMRVFLPRGSCANVIARLYSNLQRAMDSNVLLATGSGEALFTEGGARDE